jgi:nicotinamide phosphoribosyltransferase
MYPLNPLHAIDAYKYGHFAQYEPGTTKVYSNFTPRSIKLAPKGPLNNDEIVFFGLQPFLQQFLKVEFKRFFKQKKEKVLAAYKRRVDSVLGPDMVTVDHIGALHDLGYVPLRIKALPEGSVVQAGTPVFTVTNTEGHEAFFWLVNYIESVLSAEVWQASTAATIARRFRKLFLQYAERTGVDPAFVDFQGHDFSFRGLAGTAATMKVGAGHLLSFAGTDSILAIDFLERYYKANSDKELIGMSVPATEHSVMCQAGDTGEFDLFDRLISAQPNGFLSLVSDGFDYFNVLTDTLPKLKDKIMARNGKVVIRPDSGDPVRIVCGYNIVDITGDRNWDAALDEADPEGDWSEESIAFKDGDKFFILNYHSDYERKEISEAEVKGSVQLLWETFGGTVNDKGFKVLDEHIGLIYGDSITLQRADDILEGLEQKGFASCNIVFGMGSFTYQYVTRDTYGFAMKATYSEVNGEPRNLFKDPKTGSGKKSAKGLLRVTKDKAGIYTVHQEQTPAQEKQGLLKTVFENGRLYRQQKLSDIRQRVRNS